MAAPVRDSSVVLDAKGCYNDYKEIETMSAFCVAI